MIGDCPTLDAPSIGTNPDKDWRRPRRGGILPIATPIKRGRRNTADRGPFAQLEKTRLIRKPPSWPAEHGRTPLVSQNQRRARCRWLPQRKGKPYHAQSVTIVGQQPAEEVRAN